MTKQCSKYLPPGVPGAFAFQLHLQPGDRSMQPAFPYRLRGQQLWLSADRCIFWEEEQSLIVSDLHFGKTGHFRKAGIAVPQSVYREDLLRLLCQIQYFRPRQLLVVGDLFHSRENKELELFLKWRQDFPHLGIQLIEGNHDILHKDWYEKAAITVNPGVLTRGPFSFVHDITDITGGAADETEAGAAAAAETYYFSGHIHPGIRLRGMGRQSLMFPCFYFGGGYAVLPAFGRWTGTVSIAPAPEDHVFAILPPMGGARTQMRDGGERPFYRRNQSANPMTNSTTNSTPSGTERGENKTVTTKPRGGWIGPGSIFQIQ